MKPVELPISFTDEGVFILEPQTILDYHRVKQGTQLVEEKLGALMEAPSSWGGNVGTNTKAIGDVSKYRPYGQGSIWRTREVLLGDDVLKGAVS